MSCFCLKHTSISGPSPLISLINDYSGLKDELYIYRMIEFKHEKECFNRIEKVIQYYG